MKATLMGSNSPPVLSAELTTAVAGHLRDGALDRESLAARRSGTNARWMPILAAAALYGLYLVYLTVVLQFSLFRSDVLLYWRESLRLATPYGTWWVPGYPFLIALARTVTFETLPPIVVMSLISGVSYLVGVGAVRALAIQLKLPHPDRLALLFAVYPFVGLTYSVWPISDITAIALFLCCFLSFERRWWLSFTLYAAFALLVHKALWFFVPVLMLMAVVKHKESRLIVPWAVLPLLAWIVAGAIHHGDILWFARWGMTHLVASRSGLPVFDGLIGPFFAGGVTKLLKALVIVTTVGAALVTFCYSVRFRFRGGAAVAAALIVLALAMNQYEIWVVARFSKVLVIPMAFVASKKMILGRILDNRWLYGLLFVSCIVSNLAYGYYMAKAFFA